ALNALGVCIWLLYAFLFFLITEQLFAQVCPDPFRPFEQLGDINRVAATST
ncbi:hypothetical protein ATANTOWER_021758, partial [Ataeniobius toweri]|nr:hypothetical protein [Ataeniobius toweri]